MLKRIDYRIPDTKTQKTIGANASHCEFFEDRIEYKSLLKCSESKDEDDIHSPLVEKHVESQGMTFKKFIFNIHGHYWSDEVSEGFTISIYAETDPIKIIYPIEQEEKYQKDYAFIKDWLLK